MMLKDGHMRKKDSDHRRPVKERNTSTALSLSHASVIGVSEYSLQGLKFEKIKRQQHRDNYCLLRVSFPRCSPASVPDLSVDAECINSCSTWESLHNKTSAAPETCLTHARRPSRHFWAVIIDHMLGGETPETHLAGLYVPNTINNPKDETI